MSAADSPFRIYNASAGSGKTYTLTREYLSILLAPGSGQAFREILAITFTNKAVTELKQRILKSLEEFAGTPSEEDRSALFREVQEAVCPDWQALKARASRVLQEILHNYAFFDVSTIDKFNYRILRTFARDLDLPAHFEVVLDTDSLLQRAVDALIRKAGEERELTRVLIDFALEKSAEDKSWDIAFDLLESGKLLFNENHFPFLKGFEGKQMADFLELRRLLRRELQHCEAGLRNAATGILDRIESEGLERLDFRSGYFPDFVRKIASGQFGQNFEAGWKQRFGDEALYSGKTPEGRKQILDALLPEFTRGFNQIRELVNRRNFLVNAMANMAPFTVLGLLESELERIQREDNLLPIARFNSIIARELAGQPAPYIYERLGEKYRHYFIDEFQDTSELQWQNLIPLIGNALEGEDLQGRRGSLVLVGDAKQAIYRWRGGKAEQLLGLIGSPGPFVFPAEVHNLPVNFRSRQTVIDFNNDFFSHVSRYLSRDSYSGLFLEGNRQSPHSRERGLVSLEFVEEGEEGSESAYLDRCLGLIGELQDAGYPYDAICVLTRTRREGVVLSDHLMKAGVPVVSSETLLLKNYPAIRFLMALLRHLIVPDDLNHRFGILEYLAPEDRDTHSWIAGRLDDLESFLSQAYQFEPRAVALYPAYDILETAIRQFGLGGASDAYLIFLMDQALEVGLTRDGSITTFLDYWDQKQDSLSISAPEDLDAVRLMTIHKSKGLEFPVVIFPFAHTPIYHERQARLWIPVEAADYAGFPYLQVSKKKEVEHYGPREASIYREDREKLELDAFNVLYVAHTRAAEALFVLTRETSSNEAGAPKSYADLYVDYLSEKGVWEPGRRTYRFGQLNPAGKRPRRPDRKIVPYRYSAKDRQLFHIVTRASALWDTRQEAAQRYGTFLHYGFSLIKTAEDIGAATRQLLAEGLLANAERDGFESLCRSMVEHPLLSAYYTAEWQVYNEKDIITKNGLLLRPDRLLIRGREAALIDYKTGKPKEEDRRQLGQYAGALEEMGLQLQRSILVYVSDHKISPEYI